MREAFTAELDAISDDLVHLTRLVGSAMNRATQSLLDADLRLAEEVIAADEQVDVLTAETEEKCFDVIALQAPVASDLRIVIGALRIVTSGDLDRIPGITQTDEIRSLHHATGGHVQAGDDALGEHKCYRSPARPAALLSLSASAWAAPRSSEPS